MYEWLTNAIGPLAAGVILLGVAPAAVLVVAMTAINRLVDWRARRAPSLAEESTPQLEASQR